MNKKVVIENREFYFYPTYIAYAKSLDGYVVRAVTQIATLGVIKEKVNSEVTVKDDWGNVYTCMISFGSVFMAY